MNVTHFVPKRLYHCPICSRGARGEEIFENDSYEVKCPSCGHFVISEESLGQLDSLELRNPGLKARINKRLQSTGNGKKLIVSSVNDLSCYTGYVDIIDIDPDSTNFNV